MLVSGRAAARPDFPGLGPSTSADRGTIGDGDPGTPPVRGNGLSPPVAGFSRNVVSLLPDRADAGSVERRPSCLSHPYPTTPISIG